MPGSGVTPGGSQGKADCGPHEGLDLSVVRCQEAGPVEGAACGVTTDVDDFALLCIQELGYPTVESQGDIAEFLVPGKLEIVDFMNNDIFSRVDLLEVSRMEIPAGAGIDDPDRSVGPDF